MAKAGLRLRESHRAAVLTGQLNRWREANELEQYLAAMETAIGGLGDPAERQSAEEWLGLVPGARTHPGPPEQ